MRTGFYGFHGLWSSSRVPFRIKRIVFKAVVSSAGLAGLEPYVLTQTDMDRLEVARDLLMRRIFGRDGWGAVAGSCEHNSVTSHSLRKKADLPPWSPLCVSDGFFGSSRSSRHVFDFLVWTFFVGAPTYRAG